MKRSRAIRLVLMGTAARSLAACDDKDKVEVGVFETVEQCTVTGQYSQAQCEQAISAARTEHQKVAPRFANRQECEAEFGAAKCTPAPENTSPQARSEGGGWFMPVMMGYMMGRMMSGGGGYMGQPLYQPQPAAGTGATGFSNARGEPVAKATGVTRVASATAVPATSPTIARSGFGSSASRFGGSAVS